jgi:hypothetical protein
VRGTASVWFIGGALLWLVGGNLLIAQHYARRGMPRWTAFKQPGKFRPRHLSASETLMLLLLGSLALAAMGWGATR